MTQDIHNNMTRNNEITARASRDYGSPSTRFRLVLILLLMMVLGVNTAWAQTEEPATDYSGTYFIANNEGYNTSVVTNNYYMVPAADPRQAKNEDAYYSANYSISDGDPEKPFITTYKTKCDNNSIWQIISTGDDGYYFIKHWQTGKYLIYEPPYTGNTIQRKCVHLQATSSPGENAKFDITLKDNGVNIRPISLNSGNQYLNPASNNKNFYNGQNNSPYYGGMVGVYSDASGNSIWHLEETVPPPTFSINPDGSVEISSVEGTTIHYLTNGTNPTASNPQYTSAITVTNEMQSIKALAVRESDSKVSNVVTLPLQTYTYYIVNRAKAIAIKCSIKQAVGKALSSYIDIPEAIRSPYLNGEEVNFYTFSGTYSSTDQLYEENKISKTPNADANIYVTYTTDHILDEDKFLHLRGARAFNITDGGNCLYDNSGTLSTNGAPTVSTATHLWFFSGNDPYAVQIQNVETDKFLVFSTAPSLSLAETATTKFILMEESAAPNAEYEPVRLMEATGNVFNENPIKEVNAYPVSISVNYHLIDKAGKLIVSVSGTSSDLALPSEWQSPLVSEYHYWKGATLSGNTIGSTCNLTNAIAITSPFDVGSGGDVYVTYDVSDAIDLEGNKTYLLRFHNGEEFQQEDGKDGVMGADKKRKAIYPYNNGDFNLYVYGQERWEDQLKAGASTRSRWLWYFVSQSGNNKLTGNNIDPYHVVVKSYQNQLIKDKKGDDNEYKFPGNTYLQTYKPSDYSSVITSIAYENEEYSQLYSETMPTSIVNGSPTEYMILGTTLQNLTLKTVNEVEGERRVVNSFEQYWKNNPTVEGLVDANPNANNTTLTGKGWHRFQSWAYSAPWGGGSKALAPGDHWYQTISMGNGEFTAEEVSLAPVLILLDQHGWEVVRVVLPHGPGDLERAARYTALRKYSSPMVKTYHYYKTATKMTGYHKFDVDKTSYAKVSSTDDTEYTTPALGVFGTLPDYNSQALVDNKEIDWYVTYDVKDVYADSYTGAATESAVVPSAYLLKQGGSYATYSGSGSAIGTVTTKPSRENTPDETLWNLKPNFDIDHEMGYKYAGESGAQEGAQSKNATEVAYWTNGQNGFDPYNVQIQNKKYTNRYFTANTSGSALDGGIWKGTSSTVTLQNLGTKQSATGNDQTTVNITNATFMVVDDGAGNMRLMPRFDHEVVMESFSTLAEQKAASTGTQTLIFDVLTDAKEIHSSTEITDMNGNYLLAEDFSFANFTSLGTASAPFTGVIDGQLYAITGPSVPLVAYARDATISNVIFKDVNITSGNTEGDAGAICCRAAGATRIYNCGILPTSDGSSVKGTGNVGGIAGILVDEARVINCYSYAEIKGGTTVAGIVGNNSESSSQTSLKTVVVNCMFYGDITGGSSKYPVYGGKSINNDTDDGINPYCYFRKNAKISPTGYNRSWPAEEKNLTRFEYYRSVLNSNRKLCTWWVNGTDGSVPNDNDVFGVGIAKWVLDPAIAPYPILKPWGKYPSIINPDPDERFNPEAKTWVPRSTAKAWEGKSYNTLSVTINPGAHGSGSSTSRDIVITDMDTLNCDYGYYKIQLPYYNDVFGRPNGNTWSEKYGGNYGEYVVTGWEISGGSNAENYNFADRNSYNGRIFAQGGYFYVPDGTTSITITAHWGKAVYLANRGYSIDRVKVTAGGYRNAEKTEAHNFDPVGTVSNKFQGYDVYDDLQSAIAALGNESSVYDQAIVLIGNHQVKNGNQSVAGSTGNWHPFTIMSADLDFDNEPDNCLELQFRENNDRPGIQPIRFDFLPVIELGLAVRHDNLAYAIGIVIPQGHFEITETAFMRTTQFEWDADVNRFEANSPVILNGGEFEQLAVRKAVGIRTSYFLLGGHLWFHRFAPGSHPSQSSGNPRLCPVNVIGGDFPEFYLSGLYRPDITPRNDQGNPFCFIDGGHFGTIHGAGYDKINGNVTFKINHAVIGEFYGGGINGSNPIGGNIDVTIDNSRVEKYCGGPEVGNMTGKTITTRATGTTFGVFYGGGNGGNSYYRQLQRDGDFVSSHIGTWTNENFHWNDFIPLGVKDDDTEKENKGYHAEYEFEVFNQSNGVEDKITQRGFIRWIQFGITVTGNVENTLNNCEVTRNFYGGGNLATVAGNVSSTLTNTTVHGNAFGAGFSAAIPTFQVHDKTTAVFPSITAGVITDGHIDYGNKVYEWTNDKNGKTDEEISADPTYQKDGKWYCYTWNSLANLGAVTGNATLIIDGEEAKVEKSVYGGGEESAVGGNTVVNVNGGTIGVSNATAYGAIVGNVYGGGFGKANDKDAGLVKGNTNVTISGNATSPFIYHNVYGGGAYGSVGEFDYDVTTGVPTGRKANTTGGIANVTITGGKIGTTGKENGMVFGSSRGDVAAPVNGVDPNDVLAWVYDTHVTIGTSNSTELTYPLIKGSIYGGGENGHTLHDTDVQVHSGTIGIESGEEVTYQGIKYSGPRYLFRGNVYGGGCGTDTYKETDAQEITKTYYNFNAGIVKGNTNVTIDGGHIVHNVYGGGAMGSVGTFTSDADSNNDIQDGKPISCAANTGKCTVVISGGVIGVAGAKMTAGGGPDDYGHVFGAGRGDAKDPEEYPNVEISAYYKQTDVTISGSALVMGSVYGGSESGHVLNDTKVTIAGGQIGCGEGKTAAYTQEEWTAESPETLKPTNHWTYVDDGAPYDQYADENGNYANNVSSEGGNRKATDGHTFYGNVFAGGSGYYPYAQGKWLFSAGCVEGNAILEITGGHILNNVYGGCEMSDVLGNVSVTMSDGTVGVPRNKQDILLNPTIGHIYGAGMGDKRIFFNAVTNVASSTVSVSGGKVYGSVYGGGEDGHVINNATTTISGDVVIGSVTDGTTSGFDGNVFGGGQGSPTALTAGTVGGNVVLNIQGGTMHGSVYGGGRIASVGTFFASATDEKYGKMQDGNDHGYIKVNLIGGTIHQSVYGGCMGTRGKAPVDQVRFAVSKNVTVELNKDVADNAKGCVVMGNIFGCNNVNSSPQGDVTVHIYATQNALASKIAGTDENADADNQPKKVGRFDVNAVYGGGNMAAYLPKGPGAATAEDGYDGKNTAYSTKVIIDGCDRTSIKQVYGGGNAATTPATEVTVNGTYEIDELFGGGNGKDKITYDEGSTWLDNPGANVGFYEYKDNASDAQTPADRSTNYGYGSGKAAVNVFGGLINHVFGGSNTKGNVRETAITLLEEKTEENSETPCCPFRVGDVYGGGKSAPMDADAKMYMACIPGLRAAYGGAEEADIQGGVTLNITNGTFERVFGGNNLSGTIRGPIEVNIEETGCKPIIIGELYGGGNEAPYSVYGYNDDGSIIETGTTKVYKDPVVNVKSFTSIGEIYGGGYGSTATMVGDPTVNVNVAADPESEAQTKTYKDSEEQTQYYSNYAGETKTIADHSVTLPPHVKGKMGVINNVFGGGNAAPVKGSTQVNIGTTTEVYMLVNQDLKVGTTNVVDVRTFYTRTGSGTTTDPYEYHAPSVENGTCDANSKAVGGVTYYKKYDVLGADIRGNVYGGGNNAEVTGNTNVTIGKEKPAP